jgi:hypothetical protein
MKPSPDPSQRLQEADCLVGERRYAEALEIYLWCFDYGAEIRPGFAGVRGSYLLTSIVRLGVKLGFRPALNALIERRDACEARLKSGAGSRRDALDFADINRYARQDARTLALFESAPADSEIKDALGWSLREYLLKSRRYEDLLRIFDPDETFERNAAGLEMSECGLEPALRRKLLRFCNPLVEALAGVGEHDRALALAGKILGIVPGPQVRQELIAHANRAGDTRLAEALAQPQCREGPSVRLKPGDLIIDNRESEGIVLCEVDRPAEGWIQIQNDERVRSVGNCTWWCVIPFTGGAAHVPEPLARYLRPATAEDARNYSLEYGQSYNLLIKIFPDLSKLMPRPDL